MEGTIRSAMPDEISPEAEEVMMQILKRKMKTCASMLVRVVRALEEKFGPEVMETCQAQFGQYRPRPDSELGGPEDDLREFCDRLDKGCVGSHRWERVVDEPDRVGYRFLKCLWAEVFNELKAPDIGHWLCDSDDPGVRSYNPQLAFERTKTLMDGDEECDHVFCVAKEGE